ncbi:MAG: ornithine cyclodeaminase [Coxiellaceae bacterium]|nr:ornithine cyclodeaminase [Coxiellaceae bacterium]
MVKLITVDDVTRIVHEITIEKFLLDLVEYLRADYSDWQKFQMSPRHATHLSYGVLELMPICGERYYSYKYVNGHPGNPKKDLQTIVAMGMLADVESGYPLMISEMTLLTAFRTAATTALFSQYLARKDSKVLAMIGSGAQSEFQAHAMKVACGIDTIQYYDVDPKAMQKFARNMATSGIKLVACDNGRQAVKGADIVTTCTADKRKAQVLFNDWLEPGQHINGLGGDCPGKTEFEASILDRGNIYIEYAEQTHIEGEVQHLDDISHCIEMHNVIRDKVPGRQTDEEITIYDSVGFSLEDYSVLRYIYQLSNDYGFGTTMPMIPDIADPKDLYSALNQAVPLMKRVV